MLVVAALGVTACDSGASTASTKKHTSTTTRRKPRHPRHATTTTSRGSTSSTTAAPTTSTTPAPPPSTDPPPSSNCGARAGPIYAAVQGGDLGPVPLANYTMADCRIAVSNQIWSAITLIPNAGSGVVQLTVVLQRMGAIWRVEAYGQTNVSCGAPPPVPTELRLGC